MNALADGCLFWSLNVAVILALPEPYPSLYSECFSSTFKLLQICDYILLRTFHNNMATKSTNTRFWCLIVSFITNLSRFPLTFVASCQPAAKRNANSKVSTVKLIAVRGQLPVASRAYRERGRTIEIIMINYIYIMISMGRTAAVYLWLCCPLKTTKQKSFISNQNKWNINSNCRSFEKFVMKYITLVDLIIPNLKRDHFK